MRGRTHLTHGVTAAAWTSYALPLPNHMRALVAVVVAVSSLAPDLDHAGARANRRGRAPLLGWLVRRVAGHRTVTHSAAGCAAYGLGVGLLAVAVGGEFGVWWWAFALGALVGSLTHVWGDARTPSGVPLWWLPLPPYAAVRVGPVPVGVRSQARQERVRLGRPVRTGSADETRLRERVYSPVMYASVAAVVYLALYAA